MKFTSDIPEYKSLSNSDWIMTSIPDQSGLWNAFEALASKADPLQPMIHSLESLAHLPPNQDWSRSNLIYNLSNAVRHIKKKVDNGKLPLFFDGFGLIFQNAQASAEEINEILEEYNIGYFLIGRPHHYIWKPRDTTKSNANLRLLNQRHLSKLSNFLILRLINSVSLMTMNVLERKHFELVRVLWSQL